VTRVRGDLLVCMQVLLLPFNVKLETNAMNIGISATLNRNSSWISLLIFVFAVGNVQAKVFDVTLTVNTAKQTLEVSDTPTKHGCSHNNPSKGCLKIGQSRKGDIGFALEKTFTCGDNDEGIWELTEIYLGGKNQANKPSTWGNLDAEVQKDFSVANYSTGRLTLRSRARSGQSMRIYDQNDAKTEYWIYYRVEAMCFANDIQIAGPIVSDPRIVNEGDPD
jgi:hypothetical protein